MFALLLRDGFGDGRVVVLGGAIFLFLFFWWGKLSVTCSPPARGWVRGWEGSGVGWGFFLVD